MIQRQIFIEEIIKLVADYYHLEVSEVKCYRRFRELVKVRQIAMYFCRIYASNSLGEIGMKFESNINLGKDHSTVLHSIRKVKEQMDIYPSFYKQIKEIEKIIEGKVKDYILLEEEEMFMQNDFFN